MWQDIRCPSCNRLACRAFAGSKVRVRCVRCGIDYEAKAL